jgi:hypothetical protein
MVLYARHLKLRQVGHVQDQIEVMLTQFHPETIVNSFTAYFYLITISNKSQYLFLIHVFDLFFLKEVLNGWNLLVN